MCIKESLMQRKPPFTISNVPVMISRIIILILVADMIYDIISRKEESSDKLKPLGNIFIAIMALVIEIQEKAIGRWFVTTVGVRFPSYEKDDGFGEKVAEDMWQRCDAHI